MESGEERVETETSKDMVSEEEGANLGGSISALKECYDVSMENEEREGKKKPLSNNNNNNNNVGGEKKGASRKVKEEVLEEVVMENNGMNSLVEEDVEEEDKKKKVCKDDSSEEGQKEDDMVGEKEHGELEYEGRGVRQSSRKAREKMRRLIAEEEEEGFLRRGKKGQRGQENKTKTNRVQANIGEQEDAKTKQTSKRKKRSVNEGERLTGSREECYALREKKAKQENVTKSRVGLKKDAEGFLESNMCHQCQRNDKGRVVRCTKCKTKRYCEPCMITWYPKMSEEAFAEACPVCRMNCNCKACLRMEAQVCTQIKDKLDVKISENEKILYSKYLIKVLLPFLEKINTEQMMELELEAKIHGVSVSDIKVKKAACD